MRVPLSWLRDYVDVELSPEALAERLTLLGMEVQGIERRGDDWSGVVVGELLEVGPHPRADRLSLTKVRTAPDGPVLSIVCGARNIAAGQRVPVALPGAELPGGRRIERATKMGETSEGMLCSGDELGLTADADGILVLPPDAPLGRPLSALLGEVVLDVDVKPNRGDALSLVGLAREVAAATGAAFRPPAVEVVESGDATTDHLAVEVAATALCPRFVGRYVEGLTIGPSPLEVQLRLAAAGMRPVSNVVDASNYVMLELGKPIHTFDAGAVHDGRFVVRLARAGERLETLDHVVRELTPETLVIADPDGPLAIAGVMGGAASEVGEGTTAVIIESAIFDPVSIRRTAHAYALRSEASLRFEKGQESGLARTGADRTAQLIAAWAGGRVARGVVDTNPIEPAPARLPFRPGRVRGLLGVDVSDAEQRELLGRVGIGTEPARSSDAVPVAAGSPAVPLPPGADALVALVPPHRRDLAIEADVAEEVIRLRGYDTLAGRLPGTPMPGYRPDPRRLADGIRDLLAGRGLAEVVTFALIGPDDHARLGIAPADPATVRVANPVSLDHSQLRRSLLPGLCGAVALAERQRRTDIGLFEIGAVHRLVEGAPVEAAWLGLVLTGGWPIGAWDRPSATADIGDAKQVVAWLLDRLGTPRPGFAANPPEAGIEHPGRTAAIVVQAADGEAIEVGRVGELDPRYLAACGVRAERVAVAQLALAAVSAVIPTGRRVVALPRVPAVERDLALVVAASQPAGEVEALLVAEGRPLLREVRLFDRYLGPPLGPDEVSLAWRLRLQTEDRTLTDSEVDAFLERLVAAAAARFGAHRRD